MKRVFLTGALCLAAISAAHAAEVPVPRYDHIFVIVEENKGFDQIMKHPAWTPVIHRLAKEYGLAAQFYAEVHSSEGNYIAMLGGDTFGIHDDDAFFCKPHMKNEFCEKSDRPNYADHDIAARSLMDQMAEKGLTWKAYMEDIPGAGSLVPGWPTANYPAKGLPYEAYAAKHNGFVHFKTVNQEPVPQLMRHLVGFRQLYADLASGDLPNYAHIIPNQCNEMHGRGAEDGPDVPRDCTKTDLPGLIHRGDAEIGMLVDKIMHSKVWSAPGNTAIVVTFDENNDAERHSGPQGCCGYDPNSLANFGGGHIPTIVIANHGPRHVVDPTPYNHYSLLRTVEDAFGINEHLAHAADTEKGVVSMTPLFAVTKN
ncbi:MAG: phosphoesterase [Alphaproteobacteria bacterium]|nr:phosphoesterase [Alphaproteobacteria bacterium]MDE2495619.1 phosphoesterase [Alphaproteobacteria bacterium]